MMTAKPLSFIAGYLFCEMDKHLFKTVFKESSDVKLINNSLKIPKIWFGLKSQFYDISDLDKHDLKAILEKSMNEMYPDWITTVTSVIPEKQYIKFEYTINNKQEKVKKMTVAEIEKELGYKIEITS